MERLENYYQIDSEKLFKNVKVFRSIVPIHLLADPRNWIQQYHLQKLLRFRRGIGVDSDDDGKGEPVLTSKKSKVGKGYPIQTAPDTDEFKANDLGLQWQYQYKPKAMCLFLKSKRRHAPVVLTENSEDSKNLWDVQKILLRKFPAEEFRVTAKLSFIPNVKLENEEAGLIILGQSYPPLSIGRSKEGLEIVYNVCNEAKMMPWKMKLF